MYRTRSMEKNNEQFVEKLCDLPVVNDALDKLGSLYTETKERNRLFRFTLQTAESGLGFVYNTAKPVVKKFEKPIETLNGLAVHQLEKLEQDYPIIAQPTDVVLKQTKETCTAAVKPLADRVKPITDKVGSATKYGVDKVQSAKQFTVGTIEGVATYGMNKVNDVKTYGVNTVIAVSDVGSKQMSKVLDNQASQLLLTQVDLIMNVADGYIDKYLPPDESEDKSPSNSKNKESDEKGQQTALISKAWNMGYKVRRRAYNRAAKELKAVRMRSVDTLSKMNPVDLMEYARTNLDGMREKVHYVWDEINKPAEQVMKEELENNEKNIKNMTYQHRFIATARHLTLTIKAGATAMNLSIETVPGPFRPFVIQALEVAQSVFKMFLARPEHMNNGTEEVHKSLPSLKPTPDQAPSSTKSQSSVKASTSKESNAENNSHEVKTTPAKVTSPAKAPEAKVNSPAKAEEDKNKKFERNPSTSSSEHQDDQTYAEPQDDSPDSYE